MPLDLVRIDDRLVHGQVVIAWGSYLNTTKIILCHDEIAQSEFEKELYMNAEEIAPHPMKICVCTQQETLQKLFDETVEKSERIILLIESPREVLKLISAGLNIARINVGGMHYRKGKRQIASYIYVDEEDILCFKKLHQMGIRIEGKDVPDAKAIDILQIVEA